LDQVLRPIQDIFSSEDHPRLLVGLGIPDDAAVWRLNDDQALVVTTDFFTPVVDTPYEYGAIAAANALSDIYAMGATPFMALNVAAMPTSLPISIVTEIMRGGAEKVREAGAVIAGGHTVQDDEPKYGLVALGMGRPEALITNANAVPGDVLILTKPLGLGVTTTALKNGRASEEHVRQAVDWMMRLNSHGSKLASEFEVRAATDVTGFGLLGHSTEMAEASKVALRFFLPSIPFFSGARHYAETGNIPGGSEDNKAYYESRVGFEETIDAHNRMLLFDAQTSGGLLLAVPSDQTAAFMRRANEEKLLAWRIGVVETGRGIYVSDEAFPAVESEVMKRGDFWFASHSA
jgi:selenide,water dikinase